MLHLLNVLTFDFLSALPSFIKSPFSTLSWPRRHSFMDRDSKLPELHLFHFSECFSFFRSWNRRKERRVFGNPFQLCAVFKT